jgi:putative tricarboxylic transport membrane protein
MALMVGAMTIHNIQPGPQVMTSNPALFWGLIASMWIGNVMLILLNLPLIGIWVKLLKIPYRFLYPAILVFCCIGVYTVNNTVFDVYVTAGFGLIGYLFFKLGCEPPPLLLGFVLGPMMEENFRRALLLSRGDFSTFVTRPLSLGLLIAAALLVVIVALPAVKKTREEHSSKTDCPRPKLNEPAVICGLFLYDSGVFSTMWLCPKIANPLGQAQVL